jgi:hypothetical protein
MKAVTMAGATETHVAPVPGEHLLVALRATGVRPDLRYNHSFPASLKQAIDHAYDE